MKLRPSLMVAVLALTLLALPAPVLAQSAGDDQYTDPLGNGSGGGGAGSSGTGSGGDTSPPTGGAPVASAGAGTTGGSGVTDGIDPSQTSGSTDTSAVASSGAGGELPATGLPAGLLAGTGLVFLLCGAVLRLGTSPAPKPPGSS